MVQPTRAQATVAGREITFETGQLARQADGAVVVRMGDTVVLVAVVAAPAARPGTDFFPLTVEYRERSAAAGRIPGARNRRETRPSDLETLASRVIDRAIRPLFPDGFRCEVQVTATLLSAEPEHDPVPLALLGASAALHISDIPWAGPIAGARFARRGKRVAAFPDEAERAASEVDVFAATGPHGLVMVEGDAEELPESELVQILVAAGDALRPLSAAQERLREQVGRPKRPLPSPPADLTRVLAEPVLHELRAGLAGAFQTADKAARKSAVTAARATATAAIAAAAPDASADDVSATVAELAHDVARELLSHGTRFDGRAPDEVRPITCDLGLLPRAHGSAVFTRGETQALATVTLGAAGDQLDQDGLFGNRKERFYLHYNFPPFSVGEVRPVRGPGRREIGHGMLAQRALTLTLPREEDFPYTIRIVSDILESNGSSSMATVCAGCLALMDAGVPIRTPVAGVAMGLVARAGAVQVLSDILGDEDHLGDMDFKVCGTADGVTAVQMDVKMAGLDGELLARAMEAARVARQHILGEMARALPAPRASLSPRAPRITALRVRPERIRDLIGPGGSRIREIIETTGVAIDVAQDGLVRVAGDPTASREAVRRIELLTHEPEVGALYRARVTTVKPTIAFVELFPGTEAGVHISEVAEERIGDVGQVLVPGAEVLVRVLGVDSRGRLRASRKAALGADPSEARL